MGVFLTTITSMFLIYINDLVALLAQYSVKVKLFANDVKLYVKIVNRVDMTSAGVISTM